MAAANALMVVKLISSYAVTQGYIDINPIHDVKINKKLRKSKRDVPTLDDISKIKKSLNCTFRLFAYFAMYTGLRKGELLALRWEDIDS